MEDGAIDDWVRASLRLVQTSFSTITSDTVKPLGLVEVEVGGHYPRWQIKEELHLLKLWQGITDQRIPIYDVYLFQGKVTQPVTHVDVIEAPLNGLVSDIKGSIAH